MTEESPKTVVKLIVGIVLALITTAILMFVLSPGLAYLFGNGNEEKRTHTLVITSILSVIAVIMGAGNVIKSKFQNVLIIIITLVLLALAVTNGILLSSPGYSEWEKFLVLFTGLFNISMIILLSLLYGFYLSDESTSLNEPSRTYASSVRSVLPVRPSSTLKPSNLARRPPTRPTSAFRENY